MKKIRGCLQILALMAILTFSFGLNSCSCYPVGCRLTPALSHPAGFRHCGRWRKICSWKRSCVDILPCLRYGLYYAHRFAAPSTESEYCPRSQGNFICEWVCDQPIP